MVDPDLSNHQPSPPHTDIPSGLREKFLRRRVSPEKSEKTTDTVPSGLTMESSDGLSSGLREKFLRRRGKSEKTDIDDVFDFKPSMKPTAKMPTTASSTVIPLLTVTSPLNCPINPLPPTNVTDAFSPTRSDTNIEIPPVLSKSPTSQKIMLQPLATPPHTLPSNTNPSTTSPRLSPFTSKTSPPPRSPPPAANPHLMEWIAQAREWKQLYADTVGTYFYQKKTTREWQWEVPTSQGYTRADTRLVLQDGTVIDDPATAKTLKASTTSKVKPDRLPTASPMNDASTMLAQMQAWNDHQACDIDDVVDLKPSMKPTVKMPTTATNAVIPAHTVTSPLNGPINPLPLMNVADADDVVNFKPSIKPSARMPTIS